MPPKVLKKKVFGSGDGPADDKAAAQQAKEAGNACIAKNDFAGAVAAYSEAILLDSTDHVFYSNRSAAYLSLKDHTHALADAEKVRRRASRFAAAPARVSRAPPSRAPRSSACT